MPTPNFNQGINNNNNFNYSTMHNLPIPPMNNNTMQDHFQMNNNLNNPMIKKFGKYILF